jgi:L-lactate permease
MIYSNIIILYLPTLLAAVNLSTICVVFLALLLLYDVTNKTSFDNIRAWLGEIREYAQDDVVIMLLGK